jgi:hypothetical protein
LAASASAIALPMPRDAPVTIAVLPERYTLIRRETSSAMIVSQFFDRIYRISSKIDWMKADKSICLPS